MGIFQAQSSEFTVGISQFVSHPALDATTQGVIDILKSQPVIKINLQNAQGNTVLASQIAQKFVGDKVSCIVAIGTTSAQTAATIAKGTTIPIVFATVTDPQNAKLVDNLQAPEGQITGSSNFTPLAPQLTLFKEIQPHLKILGMIYNPGELNGTTMVERTKNAGVDLGITVIGAGATSSRDVGNAVQSLLNKVDALFISNDNTALSAFNIIVKMATEHSIPVFVSDTDLVSQGAIAAIGPNQYEIGQAAGRLVLQIMKGVAIKDLPIYYPTSSNLYLNKTQAQAIHLNIADDLTQKAHKVYRTYSP